MAVAEPAASARPLPEYATLVTVFSAALGGFLVLGRNRLPERIGLGDLARVGVASYKVGRLVAKDEVTSWVRAPVTRDEEAQEPEREGMARALGELVTCPYCIGLWVSAVLTAALAVRPRETRVVTTVFGAQAVADFLNAAFVRVRDS
ncbi:MAG TPA: DUF1360 domain-containing protein [Gaiellaceae bacterium]|nr:DUF1360 domain-containing protein [Gaiellaceae bacterium]